MKKQDTQKNERVEEVFELFIKHIKGFLKEANLNHEEYTNFAKLGRPTWT